MASSSVAILGAAAVLTWLAVGVPIVLGLLQTGLAGGRGALALGGWLVFGLAFWRAAFRDEHHSARTRRLLILIQTAAALAVMAGGLRGVEGALLVMVATQLPGAFPLWLSFAWIAAQTLFVVAPWAWQHPLQALLVAGSFLGFQAFALGAVHLAGSEGQARQELARTNAELVATQALLSDRSRLAERLRISRELHDSLGHHLTALNLNLEAASHLAGGKAAEPVAAARALGRSLLAEVREVVGTLREETSFDAGTALRALADGIPSPRVHLTLPADPAALGADAELAHALFRCVQEVVTNAVRHASARNLSIVVEAGVRGLELTARDDGRGAARFKPGHGLTGMRERVEAAGGRLEVETRPGHGFAVRAFLPRPPPAGGSAEPLPPAAPLDGSPWR